MQQSRDRQMLIFLGMDIEQVIFMSDEDVDRKLFDFQQAGYTDMDIAQGLDLLGYEGGSLESYAHARMEDALGRMVD